MRPEGTGNADNTDGGEGEEAPPEGDAPVAREDQLRAASFQAYNHSQRSAQICFPFVLKQQQW